MNSIHELRAVLEEHASNAPGPDGLIAGAQVGAARIRRRRRIAAVTTVAAAVVVAAVAVPLATGDSHGRRRPAPPAPAASTPAPPYRAAWKSTVSIEPNAGYPVNYIRLDANWQTLSAYRPRSDKNTPQPANTGGAAWVFDAGTYDPVQFRGAQRITVSEHEAFYQPRFRITPSLGSTQSVTLPAIGWTERSGEWVVVFDMGAGTVRKSALTTFAEAIRVQAPRALPLPLRLGWVPPGLSPTGTYAGYGTTMSGKISFADRPGAAEPVAVLPGDATGWSLQVTAAGKGAIWNGLKPSLTDRFTVNGHSAWYSNEDQDSQPGDNGNRLIVELPTCVLWIFSADRQRFTRADLVHLAETAEVGRCDTRTGWGSPIR